jgi:hypothetical protein
MEKTMAEQYDNEMKGVLFKNKDRDKETQPHAKGSCQIAGVEYWVSAWTNESKAGQRYQSLSFQRKDEVHDKGVAQAKEAMAPAGDFDQDVPF